MNIGLKDCIGNSFSEFVNPSTSSSPTDVRDGTQKRNSTNEKHISPTYIR